MLVTTPIALLKRDSKMVYKTYADFKPLYKSVLFGNDNSIGMVTG